SCVPLVRRVSFLFAAIFTRARAYLYLTPAHTFAPRPYVLHPAQMLPRIRAPYRATSSIVCIRTIATPVPSTSCATTGHSPVPFVISLSIGNADVPGPGMGVVRTSGKSSKYSLFDALKAAGGAICMHWPTMECQCRFFAALGWVASFHGPAHFL
ncbi:hypothetical protein B0H14DRAFT_3578969, partial [Mycena olivaceomarginata]